MKKILIVITILLISLAVYVLYPRTNSLASTGKLSDQSISQLWKAIQLPHIVGGYVIKTNFSKSESPILWVGSYHPGVIKVAAEYIASTGGAKGVGSESFKNNDKDSPKIVSAVRNGQITCDVIENASLSKMVPDLLEYVHSMCFMPIPAFDNDFPQILVFLFDIPLNEQDEDIRKELLKVQLEITQREYNNVDVQLIK